MHTQFEIKIITIDRISSTNFQCRYIDVTAAVNCSHRPFRTEQAVLSNTTDVQCGKSTTTIVLNCETFLFRHIKEQDKTECEIFLISECKFF